MTFPPFNAIALYVPAGHRDSEAEQLYLKTVTDTLATVIERKHNELRLHQLAHNDQLTGLPTRLLRCVRKSDTIARMGGDEFTVILSNVSKEEQAAQIAEKIIATLSEPFELGEHSRRIGCSIGIALYPADGEDITDLLKNGDIAMYRAKETRNSYRYFSHL
ncbi:MAG: GGDEF domain-containing protein [Mariprofundus sp.]|nr:GGDEF domain-containing protein [Mariprofundus sp.]